MTSTARISFAERTAAARELIEAALARRVECSTQSASPGYECPDALREAICYTLLAPGKRIRPLLALFAAEACGGVFEDALPAACAVEMVHAYSLVHDDLPAMDDDDLRRGRPTCHKAFGEATAILVGDALLSMAFEGLATEVHPAERAAECCATLARAAGPAALVGGQIDDLAAEGRAGQLGQLLSIHARKSGALLVASLRLGGITVGATPEQLDALTVFGQQLGLAFQIVDDVLDVRGDEAALGKRVGQDSQRGKLTFPALLGLEESHRRAGDHMERAIAALEPLAPRADGLEQIARYVMERDH